MTDLGFDLAHEPKEVFSSFEEATQYLESACVRAGVNHLSYWHLAFIDGAPENVSWIATYDPVYMSHYMSTITPAGDDMFEAAIKDDLVADWTEWVPNDKMTSDLLQVAMKYGITKYGITFPLHDGDFGDILFSINVKSNDTDWILERGDLIARFRPFALYFHQRIKPLIESRKLREIDFAA
jgi:hypothetical protein